MENFVQEIMPPLLQLLATVVLGLIGLVVPKVKKYFDELGVNETLMKYDYLADIAVKAVEQIYQNENGYSKKEKAKEYVLDSLNDLGLTITDTQLDMFIENAVKRMNDEWKKEQDIVTKIEKRG
ncbi:phage holin [Ignavigranum ruoffiae]|uniref:phage holin n=1 Tax=Ignavigranum ruoffiae TaxID=89093 RepID=UPI00235763CE|nr:phage holin [Ignavigranum ruoffiae]